MQVLSATEFKATCLEMLDRVGDGSVGRIVVTKRGKPVAALVPVGPEPVSAGNLHGFLRHGVEIPDDIDLTAPVSSEGEFDAEHGTLHE